MKERSVVLLNHEVSAILSGEKTQLRRPVSWILRDQSVNLRFSDLEPGLYGRDGFVLRSRDGNGYWNDRTWPAQNPLGCPGDRRWVREAWAHDAPDLESCRAAFEDVSGSQCGYGPYYRATEEAKDTLKWLPAISMPRWASRLTLEIAGVFVHRLQNISETEIRAEGIDVPLACKLTGTPWSRVPDLRTAFRLVWDHANSKRRRRENISLGDPGHRYDKPWRTVPDENVLWDADPWVFATSFRVVETAR